MTGKKKFVWLEIRWTIYLFDCITGCVSISSFALLVSIPIGIASPVVWLKLKTVSQLLRKKEANIK